MTGDNVTGVTGVICAKGAKGGVGGTIHESAVAEDKRLVGRSS